MNLGLTLRTIRKQKGINQQELADKAKLSRSYLSQIENGECNPTIETMTNLSNVLNIPFPVLLFLSMDINTIQEEKREEFKELKPTLEAMIKDIFLKPESEGKV